MNSDSRRFSIFPVHPFLVATALLCGTALPVLHGQAAPPIQLDEMVVSAQRSAHPIQQTPSSITLVALDELFQAGTTRMTEALAGQPGTTVVNTGATGSQSSVFLRGASSHQTLFLVDGIRMNDRSAAYPNVLGSSDLVGLDRLEVLRGPQGTLYGSSAMGGVIALQTVRGVDGTTGRIQAEYGSFQTFSASAAVAGGVDSLGYSFSAARMQTDNDRPQNSFESWTYSGRFEGQVTQSLLIGATLRGLTSTYEEPGATTFPFPGTADLENNLITVYGEFGLSETFTSRLTGGYYLKDYTFTSDFGASPSENSRQVVDWQNTIEAASGLEIIAGLNYEKSRFEPAGRVTRDDDFALYLSALYRPVDAVTLTAGIRHDDFESVGGATTWRTGISWMATSTTHFRGTVGTGFSAPGSEDRYGVPAWGQLANPEIQPETSTGWDAGIDQEFPVVKTTLSATVFANRYHDLFEYQIVDWNTYEGMVVNRARASTEGVEFAVVSQPHPLVSTRLSYTWLDAVNDTDGTRLIRRPRHTLDASVQLADADRWSVGLGLRAVADRTDQVGVDPDDFVVLRAFGRFRIREQFVLTARVENLLNDDYEEVAGYPALPFGAFGGVEWTF
ncbi:MAG: TonB-dependent receptor [Opitutaceae bacterium]